MNPTTHETDELRAAEGGDLGRGPSARRRQILSAAEECFSRKGFHAASMADIGRQAGINPGHIYYYFANKEELVAAVVEAELGAFFAFLEAVPGERNMLDAVVEMSGHVAIYYANQVNSGLWLEILAESGRNPRIADVVRAMDGRVRERVCAMLRALNAELGGETPESRISVQYEVLSALVSGFAIRAVAGLSVDEGMLRAGVTAAVRSVLDGRAQG